MRHYYEFLSPQIWRSDAAKGQSDLGRLLAYNNLLRSVYLRKNQLDSGTLSHCFMCFGVIDGKRHPQPEVIINVRKVDVAIVVFGSRIRCSRTTTHSNPSFFLSK
jgi:hypothetical protein